MTFRQCTMIGLAPCCLMATMPAQAEAVFDGTMRPDTLGLTLNGQFEIGAEYGQQRGANLFHSFERFNINIGESATFSGPNSVNNIISRVTGGNPSNIDGLLRSSIPEADVYLINPAGLMFGPNAKLDVQGSFHASTADTLRLGNGGQFNARQPNNSLLTVAPVEAFGFLNNTVGSISVTGRGEISQADWDEKPTGLSVPTGKTLSLLGGKLEIKDGTFYKTITIGDDSNESTEIKYLGSLNAPDGRINLASVAGAGEVVLGDAFLDVSSFRKLADIQITDKSLLQVSGEGGGSVFIRSEQMFVDDSAIEAKTLGDQDGSLLDIQVGKLSVVHNSYFDASTEGRGKNANIKIDARDSVSFSDGGHINMNTYNVSEPGTVFIQAKNIYFENEAKISNSTYGKGNAGKIIIQAKELVSIKKYSIIYLSPFGNAEGNGGTLLIEARDIIIADGSYLSGTTFAFGNNGDITIHAGGKVTLSGANTDGLASGIFSNSNPRTTVAKDAGNIVLEANELIIEKGAMISSSTIARPAKESGQGGNITIRVHGAIKLSGVNPYGRNEEGFGTGIYVRAQGDNTGNAGNISIKAETLSITNGAVIESSTTNTVPGGSINIHVNGAVFISGNSSDIALKEPAKTQRQFKEYFPDFQGSNISISGIYSNSSSTAANAGNSGVITVQANTITLTDGGQITTEAANATGGNITVITPKLLYLREGKITTSVHGGKGEGGNIRIGTPVFLVLDGAEILAQADEGKGGNITILSGRRLSSSNKSVVDASSQKSISGKVEIRGKDEELSSPEIAILPATFFNADVLLESRCNTLSRQDLSHFLIIGRDILPSAPGDLKTHAIQVTDVIQSTHSQFGTPSLDATFGKRRKNSQQRVACGKSQHRDEF